MGAEPRGWGSLWPQHSSQCSLDKLSAGAAEDSGWLLASCVQVAWRAKVLQLVTRAGQMGGGAGARTEQQFSTTTTTNEP